MRTDKENQVIEAAYGVFFRYGFARTTMGDLAKAAGMSRPALYLVYPGKLEVFQAVADWMSDNMLESFRTDLKADWPLERKLLHVLEVCIAKPFEEVKANPDAYDLVAMDGQMPELHRVYGKLQVYLSDLLEDAVKQSGLKTTACELARTLMSAMRGFKLAAKDGKDLRQLMALQLSLTMAALGQPV
ncbi:TetR/AcrR family transcriptional regulator [Pseudomonas izuensis]|uniref:TetR/AcrR family transcriptional regulator n=1 Tax=Pseudomonas izuensis TaxID=2684212 RepID=UPI00135C9D28|nr:TetR/AcrR family transcriptional regulator [Pseudomonas izuensis]